MDWIEALILGIVQGLTEFLPVSSSGHLQIFSDILGLNLSGADALDFDATLHVATALATIVVLWAEMKALCTSFFTMKRDDNTRLVWKLLLSCLPVAVVGLFFKDTVEGFFAASLTLVGVCLLVTAALLAFASFATKRQARMAANSMRMRADGGVGRPISWYDAFIIGLAQAVAVLPGLSRSGTTISTGLILGDKREQVARFSFLMVLIPILGEALLDVKEMFEMSGTGAAVSPVGWLPLLVGFVAAFIVGCVACKWMLGIVRKGNLLWFALYCLVVGIICIVWN